MARAGGSRAIQINAPRAAIAITDQDINRTNDLRRLLRDPTFESLVGPSLLGLDGHLETLAGDDLPELSGLWIALINMLVCSLAGRDTNGTDTAKRAGYGCSATSAPISPTHT